MAAPEDFWDWLYDVDRPVFGPADARALVERWHGSGRRDERADLLHEAHHRTIWELAGHQDFASWHRAELGIDDDEAARLLSEAEGAIAVEEIDGHINVWAGGWS